MAQYTPAQRLVTEDRLPILAEELGIGGSGSGSGTGSRLVSGGVEFAAEDEALPPFVVATTEGAIVEGVTLSSGQMAAFWFLSGAWHVMVHGQDTVWRSTAKPDTRIAVTPMGPTWTDATSGGSWTTPAQTGIVYIPASGSATAGQVVTVTATISDSATYKFATGVTTSWVHTFPDPSVPIGESFDGPAGTLLAGTTTDTAGKTWGGSGWTLDGAGAATVSGAFTATLPTVTNKADVTLDYGAIKDGRLDFGFGDHIRLQMSIFAVPSNQVAVYVNSGEVWKGTITGATGGGKARLRYDGTTVTAWLGTTQLYTGAATIAASPFQFRTQGSTTTASVTNVAITNL